MTFLLDILEDYLDLRELQYSRLDGTMSFSVRQEQVPPSPYCNIVMDVVIIALHSLTAFFPFVLG